MTGTRRSKPRYAELGDLLQAAIEKGDHPVGTLLPTELELCERFNVSRHTARAALAQLISAGLVQRRPGAGTRVIAQNAAMRYEQQIDTVDLLMQYGNTARLEVLEAERLIADLAMAQYLDIAEGKDYLRLHCLRLEEHTHAPGAVIEVLIPIRTGVPTERFLDIASTARTLARFLEPGRLSRVEQVFDATAFDAGDAKLLDIRKHEPALRVQRRYRDAQGRLLLITISLHPPGRFAYSMVLSRSHR
ncbi:GntR family transcriptional regulator [Stenotrophomonas sp. MH1]|uniref:GntR family transcriptional regulator n=2 Tax=Stenotrophomonas capsici TaxID=3110230 RepID=A0ABU5V3U2_9GAMM|nr:GntR family transcriptional regulator [Stenotrophomonas sp. MH1]MEA5668044.1 GntR family transcriptional regulator [Stenotrophomonas sp. MH1]